ncbi:MAG: DUF1684 domain-containing protein [Bacteroidetes bacterium]|nr:MAG: DUF1684 domain-containing protein [Bacteroidota bacterium]UCE70543.1 MAG: DUF1684 domain-containing protein [Flavobacteriaceae bacterium]
MFFGLVLTLSGCRDGKRYHDLEKPLVFEGNEALADIQTFRNSLNESFRDPETSPLPDRYRKNFEGLDFFEPDTNYRIWARLERTPEALPFDMPTSTNDSALERVFGKLTFKFEGTTYVLEVYQSPELLSKPDYEDYLFLPFTDDTNGVETYDGGRYIDLRIPEGDSILIDFNKAYNPYCAYNPSYSCPLVPPANHLPLSIPAGVMAFKK